MKLKTVVMWSVVFGAFLGAMWPVRHAHATPGAVNVEGCHSSRKIGYHCHPERAGRSGSLPGDGTHAQRDKRLARECKGMPNAGACLGFGK